MYRKYSITFIWILCLGSLFFSPSIYAEQNVKDCLEADNNCLEDLEQNEEKTPTESNDILESNEAETGSIIVNVIKIVVALILVVLLIYIFLSLLKKKNKLAEQHGVLENLGGISVGQQKSIQIVRIGEKVYAIGVGQDVTMLDEIVDETVISDLEESVVSEPQPMIFIQNLLAKKRQKQQAEVTESPHFHHTLKQELQKLKQQRDTLMDTNKKDDDIHE